MFIFLSNDQNVCNVSNFLLTNFVCFFSSLGDILAIHKALMTHANDHSTGLAQEDVRFLVRMGHIVEDTFRKLQCTRPQRAWKQRPGHISWRTSNRQGTGPCRQFFIFFVENLNKQKYKFLGYVIVLWMVDQVRTNFTTLSLRKLCSLSTKFSFQSTILATKNWGNAFLR